MVASCLSNSSVLVETMKFLSMTSLWALVLLFLEVQSFVLPKPTQNCSTFAASLSKSFAGQKITIFNATLVLANSTSNDYEYCQVVGKVAYGNNDTLNFQVYLPEATAYTGRFMAVGLFNPFLLMDFPLTVPQETEAWLAQSTLPT